jgi:hypothetical protein
VLDGMNVATVPTFKAVFANILLPLEININIQIMGDKADIDCHAHNNILYLF